MASFGHPQSLRTYKEQSRPRALVATHNPKIGTAFVDLLRDLGYQVWAAADAQMAINLCGGIAFELTLSDLALNGAIDGLDLAIVLRRRYAEMNILLLAGPADDYRAGIEDFVIVRKPKISAPQELQYYH